MNIYQCQTEFAKSPEYIFWDKGYYSVALIWASLIDKSNDRVLVINDFVLELNQSVYFKYMSLRVFVYNLVTNALVAREATDRLLAFRVLLFIGL